MNPKSIKQTLSYNNLKLHTGAKCPVLPTIKSGFIVDPTREYYFGDEARVQCNRGYKLTGSNIIQCGPSQRFDNVPSCDGEYIYTSKDATMMISFE